MKFDPATNHESILPRFWECPMAQRVGAEGGVVAGSVCPWEVPGIRCFVGRIQAGWDLEEVG